MSYAGRIARELSGMLGQALLIFIIVAFMLVETSGLHRKLHAIPGVSEENLQALELEKNFQDVRRYVSLKSIMSLLTGTLVTLWLWILGIDNAIFMGLLAFFLNFVPTIGSFIAAIPGVLLGFILLGPAMAAVTAIGYIVINLGVSNVIEPRFMGQSLGISPLVIIVSLVFWGWLLGPVGMLLSIPLTMAVKVGLEGSSATRSIAVLLGPPPKV
jgi:predicted PurR-regulated permease PerM